MRDLKTKKIVKDVLAIRIAAPTLREARELAQKHGIVLSDYVRLAIELHNREYRGKKASGC